MPIFSGEFIASDETPQSKTGAEQLARLLPPGEAWQVEAGSVAEKFLQGLADEFERIRKRGADLIEETDPRTATETLPEWEAMLSIPDELITAIPGTTAARRVAITAKYASRGGQSYDYLAALSLAAGYPLISITRGLSRMLRIGARIGDRVYGNEYAYSILFTVGAALAGALPHADFERVIRHALHSHFVAQFSYT